MRGRDAEDVLRGHRAWRKVRRRAAAHRLVPAIEVAAAKSLRLGGLIAVSCCARLADVAPSRSRGAPARQRIVDLGLPNDSDVGSDQCHEPHRVDALDRHRVRRLVVLLARGERHNGPSNQRAESLHHVAIRHDDSNERRIRGRRWPSEESALAFEYPGEPVEVMTANDSICRLAQIPCQ
jgi:hypothetical protein